MKIQPVNNNCSVSSFKARLPKKEVNSLIQEAKTIPSGLPKLYTLLKFLDKIPTSYLNFTKTKSNDYFLVDKSNILGIAKNKFDALKYACVGSNTHFGPFSYMAESVYEKQWQNNLDKTEEDIFNLSLNV